MLTLAALAFTATIWPCPAPTKQPGATCYAAAPLNAGACEVIGWPSPTRRDILELDSELEGYHSASAAACVLANEGRLEPDCPKLITREFAEAVGLANVADVLTWVEEHGPVPVCTAWPTWFESPVAGWLKANHRHRARDAHCWTVTGVAVSPTGEIAAQIMNNRGPAWGNGGFAWIALADLEWLWEWDSSHVGFYYQWPRGVGTKLLLPK